MAEISITDQMEKILDEYTKEVKRATNNSFDLVAKQAVQKLKGKTWKKKVGRNYSAGWRLKRERGLNGINDVVVYNATYPQLTHLLEYGHDVYNAKGKVGRAEAHPHIGPVEEWASNELPLEIKKELE